MVYKAEDTRLHRFVALKFLPSEVARDPQALARFQREAEAASAGEGDSRVGSTDGDTRMALTSGTKLGPYEIQSPLGAGGMGEVYRARDPRLGREVAIKVLPASLSAEPVRLQRFEQEARSASALNHTNILVVYDVGTHDGAPYLVTELLEGETLRERLRVGAMPLRKTLDYSLQIVHGLAAAHDKGIVHRDLKPENLFVTKDGRVKILDFGLAKLTHAESNAEDTTRTIQSEAGTVVGTPGYMSPEQIRGKSTDLRTDLFAFGAIFYEMLSGNRAFQGDTAADTMTAILTKDVPEVTQAKAPVPTALDHIMRHCLEKSPEERFQSAHDLAFNLEMLSSPSGTTAAQTLAAPRRGRHRVSVSLLAVATVVVVLAGGVLLGRFTVSSPPIPPYKPLTFRRGTVWNARYAPDGHSVVYSAVWDGARPELFSVRTDVPSSVPLGIANADVVSISRSGEMALVLNRQGTIELPNWINNMDLPLFLGTLARAPLSGGSPRPVLEDVLDADWSHDGNDFVVTHFLGQHFRLEYPIGKVLYEMPGQGWLSHPRFSPKGDKIAFLEHPVTGNDLGSVEVIDLVGNKKVLSSGWASVRGLAWSPSGDEVWFTAAEAGYADAVHVVTLSGRHRMLARLLPDLTVQDVTADGHVLLVHSNLSSHIFARSPGQAKEQELTFLELSALTDISADGEYVLLGGFSIAYSVFLRKTDGSPPVRLGDGVPDALSPDGKWVLGDTVNSPVQLRLLPTGPGQPRQITNDNLDHHNARFLGRDRIIFTGFDAGHQARIFVQSLQESAKPQPVAQEGVSVPVPSHDGKFLAARLGHTIVVCALDDCSHPQSIPGLGDLDSVITWAADNRQVLVGHSGVPYNVFRVDPWTGRSKLFKQFVPADPAGVSGVAAIVTPDGKHYAYGVEQALSDLYEVERLK